MRIGWLNEYPTIQEQRSTSFDYDPQGHTSLFFESSVLIEDTEVTGTIIGIPVGGVQ